MKPHHLAMNAESRGRPIQLEILLLQHAGIGRPLGLNPHVEPCQSLVFWTRSCRFNQWHRLNHQLCSESTEPFGQGDGRFQQLDRGALLEQNRTSIEPFFHGHDPHTRFLIPFEQGPLDGTSTTPTR